MGMKYPNQATKKKGRTYPERPSPFAKPGFWRSSRLPPEKLKGFRKLFK